MPDHQSFDFAMSTVCDEREAAWMNSGSDSEDSFTKEDREQRLYSQIHHDTAGWSENFNVFALEKSGGLQERSIETVAMVFSPPGNASRPATKEDATSLNVKDTGANDTIYCNAIVVSDVDDTDSDVQVVKEVVRITYDDSADGLAKRKPPNSSRTTVAKRRRTSSAASTSTDDEELPLWSRLGSGAHEDDAALSVHIRTHGRQRHDSILSHASSALGDNDMEPLVSLCADDLQEEFNEFTTLEDVLGKLPDKGWNIIQTDYKVSSLGNRRALRYHNLRCRNCDGNGHVSSACTVPKKQKPCSLCSQLHQSAKDRRFCPRTACTWCLKMGHSTRHCAEARILRSAHCERCGQLGHKDKICHELWRQWHATAQWSEECRFPTVPDNPARKGGLISCANCAHTGHHSHECKATAWWQSPILPAHVVYYNSYGHEGNFKRTYKEVYIKRPGRHKAKAAPISSGKKSVRQSAIEEVETKPDTGNSRAAKRKQATDDQVPRTKKKKVASFVRSAIETDKDAKVLTRKEKKLAKKIAKRDGRPVNKQSNPANQRLPGKGGEISHNGILTIQQKNKTNKSPLTFSKSGTKATKLTNAQRPGALSEKPKKIKPTKSERKTRRKLKEQLGIAPASTVAPRGADGKSVRNKKANDRKKSRKEAMAREGIEGVTGGYGPAQEWLNRSSVVRSWNDAF